MPEPFSTESVEELARYRAVLDTSMGEITLSFTPDKAPNHVRNFLRLAQSGVYDGMSFHRVVKGFVIQSGHLPTRRAAERDAAEVRAADEGGVQRSGARQGHAVDGEAGRAGFSQHLVLHRHGAGAQALDGKYSAFGKVESGLDVVEKIEAVALNGESRSSASS